MREIKFRAWGSPVRLSQNEPPKEMVYFNLFETDGYWIEDEKYNEFMGDSCEIMQYTGLKDRNDKEIYDGDILATSNRSTENDLDIWFEKDYGYTEVYWDEKHSCWLSAPWHFDNYYNTVYSLCHIRVIGNIHENPELLESEVSK